MRLEVMDANCGYEQGKAVQRYLNFSVENGEICCVLGPNGCGKSTVFKSVLGLIPLLSGKITVDGSDTSKWSASKLADTMAYVSQNHVPPFPYKVKDVVMLGRMNKIGYMGRPKPNDRHIIDEAMQDMGIYDMRERIYMELSGGELQLVMIARALAQQPQVMVLDEPTAALDYGNAVRVIEKVRSLRDRDLAVIMTTHSPDHAFLCRSNVVLLQKNEPMIFGSAEEVITEANMRNAYGVDVKIVEFTNNRGEVTRLCSPEV